MYRATHLRTRATKTNSIIIIHYNDWGMEQVREFRLGVQGCNEKRIALPHSRHILLTGI